MFTKEEIKAQLQMLAVPQDRPVLVHSSMKAVGEVEGRAEGLLEVLIGYVTAQGGLLCIPTHTWGRIEKGIQPSADFSDYHTSLGILSDVAAQHPDGHRSLHPSHSMVVFGEREKAEAYIARDLHCKTPMDENGCYGGLIAQDGAVLLLGVGHNKNTFIHVMDEVCRRPNRLTEKMQDFYVRTAEGEMLYHPMYFMYSEGIPDPSVYFGKFEPAFRAHGCVQDGMVGKAATQLCSARKMAGVLKRIYERCGERELLADHSPLDPTLWR